MRRKRNTLNIGSSPLGRGDGEAPAALAAPARRGGSEIRKPRAPAAASPETADVLGTRAPASPRLASAALIAWPGTADLPSTGTTRLDDPRKGRPKAGGRRRPTRKTATERKTTAAPGETHAIEHKRHTNAS